MYADIALAYFELFRKNEGNLKATWNHIEAHGPFFPEITRNQIPEGFKVTDHLKRRSTKTGQLCPSISGLQHMLINVAYIGHWIHKGVIVQLRVSFPMIYLWLPSTVSCRLISMGIQLELCPISSVDSPQKGGSFSAITNLC